MAYATAALLSLVSAPSAADEPTGCACAAEPGDRRHDGFFARSEPGAAWLFEFVSDEGPSPRRNRIRGFGQSASLSFGTTPNPGLVLGVNVWTARLSPTFVDDGVASEPDDDSIKITMLRLGPFFDWYPDPRRGFHTFGALAFAAQVESDFKGDPVRPSAIGGSVSTGFGHEWFVGSEFSLGVFGRVALGGLLREAAGGDEQMLFLVPELGLTATYH